jgi:hypothetical protein
MTLRCSILVVTLALLGTARLVHAQGESKPAQPETKPETKPEAGPAQPHEPTLDELLGLPNAKPAEPKPGDIDAKPEGPDRAKAELERQLSPTEISESFEQAVQLMGQTAQRLDTSHDTGLDTQRMQEDVIRKLDVIIDQAKKQQSKSKSKKPKPDSSQQQQQQQQQSSQKQSKTNDPKQGGGPDLQNGGTHAAPGGTAAWGNLPEHVRNALVEGTTEGFSSMYKTLTQKYYERLAKEPSLDSAPTPTAPTTPPAPPGDKP